MSVPTLIDGPVAPPLPPPGSKRKHMAHGTASTVARRDDEGREVDAAEGDSASIAVEGGDHREVEVAVAAGGRRVAGRDGSVMSLLTTGRRRAYE